MITIYTFDEIGKINTISEVFKDELKRYFQEIAEGIVGNEWREYSLEEVGPILVIEHNDKVDILDEYGLMQGSKTIPMSIPEFALRTRVDGRDMLKIIWICNDSFGLSVYYPIGQFGKEFDEYIMEFLMD
ncbi:hypothetical protein NBE98_22390 [Clostridium swellfunianum]|uniref:hypothetical protein n=1 Tax=Clostridium swellfunianum TaxID=1367462 RepID=UPI00202E9F89|nr:hypothetical protein [Clostridium swellfunianum]MCM0651111.1 hypothetical protein [Clostridium swellfunianum]